MSPVRLTILLAATACAGAAFAAAPTRTELARTSWGRAGVSLDQYRADAVACASQAVNLDFSQSNVGKTMVAATRAIDTVYSGAWMYAPAASVSFPGQANGSGGGSWAGGIGHDVQQVIHAYRVDDQFAAVSDVQYRTLQTCLSERGYRQFRLSADQQQALHHLRRGSDARRNYLHSLASDPAVLSSQGL